MTNVYPQSSSPSERLGEAFSKNTLVIHPDIVLNGDTTKLNLNSDTRIQIWRRIGKRC